MASAFCEAVICTVDDQIAWLGHVGPVVGVIGYLG